MFSMRGEECQFKLHSVSENDVRTVTLNMDEKKANLTDYVSAGILEDCVDSYIFIFTKILNTSLERRCFPNQLKLAEVTQVFKEENGLSKENYSLVSILSHLFKIFESIAFN